MPYFDGLGGVDRLLAPFGNGVMEMGQLIGGQGIDALIPQLAAAGIEPPVTQPGVSGDSPFMPVSYNPMQPPAPPQRQTAGPILRPSVPTSEAPAGSIPQMGMGEQMAAQPAPLPQMSGPGAFDSYDPLTPGAPVNVPLPRPNPTSLAPVPVPGAQNGPDAMQGVPLPRPRPTGASQAAGTDASAQAKPASSVNDLARAAAGVKAPSAPENQKIQSPSVPRPAAMAGPGNLQLIQQATSGQIPPLQLLRLAQAISGGK